MSSTMTLTIPSLPAPRLSTIPCCPNCGHDFSLTLAGQLPQSDEAQAAVELRKAQAQIDDMQAQIRLLNAKATAAVDRWADYEDELASLRRELNNDRRRSGTPVPPSTPTVSNTPASPTSKSVGSPGVSSFATAATNRISALLSRKSTPNLKAAPPGAGHQTSYSASNLLPTPPPSGGGMHQTSYSTSSLLSPKPSAPLSLNVSLSSGKTLRYTPGSNTPPPSTDDLLDALGREQGMRLAAEGKLNDTSREVEDLSVTLFEQANEMVATERRARARLEERVGELERREGEKKKRLERLESAVGRIERVRNLLGEEDGI